MKRSFYQIEGDTLTGGFKQLLEKKKDNQIKSYFSWLTVDIFTHILIYLHNDAQDFQHFLSFLFQEFGLDPETHKSLYSENEGQLLTLFKHHLSEGYPSLFRACRESHLQRISYCTGLEDCQYRVYSPDEKYTSFEAIYKAKYAEVYTFINHDLCECCRKRFSENWEIIDRGKKIPLCKECHNPYKPNLIKTDTLDYRRGCEYYFLTERKLRQFCKIPRKVSLRDFLESHLIRSKIYFGKSRCGKDCYLLKDALPFIHSKFKKNYHSQR